MALGMMASTSKLEFEGEVEVGDGDDENGGGSCDSFLVIGRASDGSLNEDFEDFEHGTLTDLQNKVKSANKDQEERAEEIDKGDEAPEEGEVQTLDDDDIEEDLSLDMAALDKLLKLELDNLESIKKANSELKKMMTSTSSKSPAPAVIPIPLTSDKKVDIDATSKTSNLKPPPTGIKVRKNQNQSRRHLQKNQSHQQQLTSNFIQNYYRSLDNFSRYIILASISGFCVAFLLLSWHGSQIHRNDMELFKLKEGHHSSQQQFHERSQERYESFRETLIHQRYEETRACQETLKTYLKGREDLSQKLNDIQKDSELVKSQLEEQVRRQREEILELQTKLKDLQHQNQQKEKGLNKVWSQFLIGFWQILKSRGGQLAIGAGLTYFFWSVTWIILGNKKK